MSSTVDTAILGTFDYESKVNKSNGLLDKIKIGSSIYEVKDTVSRMAINAMLNGDETVAGSIAEKIYNKAKDAFFAYNPTDTSVVTIGAKINSLQDQIDAAAMGSFNVVSALPTTDIKQKVIYLVPKTAPVEDGGRGAPAGTTGYVEWVYVDVSSTSTPDLQWEEIGDTDIDLSDYYTKEEIDTALANIRAEVSTSIAEINAELAAHSTSLAELANADSTMLADIGEWSDSSIFADTSVKAAIEGVYDAIAGQSTDTFVTSVALDNAWDAGTVSDLAMDTTDTEMVVFTKGTEMTIGGLTVETALAVIPSAE